MKHSTVPSKDKPRSGQTGSSDNKIPTESIFYWYCNPCKIPNSFLRKSCNGCKKERESSRSTPSALLELAENMCIVDGDKEASQGILSLYRQSIPPYVLNVVQNMLHGPVESNGRKLNMEASLPADAIFCWQCSYCTMDNSYKRWSCGACKKKVRLIVIQSMLTYIHSHILDTEERRQVFISIATDSVGRSKRPAACSRRNDKSARFACLRDPGICGECSCDLYWDSEQIEPQMSSSKTSGF